MVTKAGEVTAPVTDGMALTVIEPTEISTQKERASGMVTRAIELARAITDDVALQKAADVLNEIASFRKAWGLRMNKVKSPQYEAWQASIALEKEIDAPYAKADATIREAMRNFNDAREREYQKRKREEEEIARKKADEERLKLAVVHESTGNVEEMERVLDDEHSVPAAPAPVAPPPKIKGVSFQKVWKAEVLDMLVFAKAVGEGKIPVNMIEINQAALNGVAKALKAELKWPGVRAYEESSANRR